MKSKTPPLDTISASQFKNLQSKAGIQNKDLATLVKISTASISAYRNGKLHAPARLVEKLREIAAKPKTDTRHMEAATAARIRHLVSDLYPQWCEVKTDGHIFTG